jgi:cell division protein FtsL
MRKNKKGTKFERFAKKFLIGTFMVFIIATVFLSSYESTINVKCQKVEKEISSIQSDIDALNMEKQDLASFSRISSIATSKGYELQQSSVATTIVGVEE